MGCLETAGLCVGGRNFGILVVLAAVLVYIPVAGLLNSFGIFVEELNERFCPTDCIQLLSWIGALTFGANRLFAWVTVALQRVFPPLVLFLAGVVLASGGLLASSYVRELGYLFATYCALFGVGSSLVMTSPYALIEEYFPLSHRYHLLATSIMNVGGPVGALVMNPLAAYLDTVEEHTWRSTLRILAVVTFLMGSVCAIFMRRRRYDVSQVESTVTSSGPGGDRKSYEAMEDERCVDKDKPVYSVRDVINFFLWVTAIFFLSFGIYIPKVHFIQFMTNLHIDKQEAARCMSYEGLSEAVLSFLIALLGGGLQRHLLLCYVVCSLMLCVASGLLLLASRIIHIAVYVTVHGAVDGMTLTILYTAVSGLTRDITTKRYLWSATYFVNGLGQILGIPLAGLVFDRTKSYHLVFIIASITFGSSMFLFAILAYRQHRHGQDVLPPSIERNIPPATPQSPPQTATEAPTQTSTEAPTQTPTETPTEAPTQTSTQAPTQTPTQTPTQAPTTTDDTAVPVHEKSKGSFFKSRKQDPEKIPLTPTDPKDANETTTAK